MEINSALEEIADATEQSATTRHEADSFSKSMDILEIVFLCDLWNRTLIRLNATCKSLQSTNIDMRKAVDVMRSLADFIQSLRVRFLTSLSYTPKTDPVRNIKQIMQD